MFEIKKGRKLKKSFKIYSCNRCGYEGITCDNDEIVNHKQGTKYEKDFYTRKVKKIDGYNDPHTVCPNCDHTIGYAMYTEEMDKDYINKLVGTHVTLENGVRTILTEDDLFY